MKPIQFTALVVFVLQSVAHASAVWERLHTTEPFAFLPGEEFKALGQDLELPDGGATLMQLAKAAPGGAFDPRVLNDIDPEVLGYDASWEVVRYNHYNLDWDITGLRLESLHPEAGSLPWLFILHGGSANFYEFFNMLDDRPGWGQYLAQRVNVMIVTMPGNFKYGGWEAQPENRKVPYLLDTDMSEDEQRIRHMLINNTVILQGIKRLIMEKTTGEFLFIGHSTGGELPWLLRDDPEVGHRLKNRYIGWGSGGPARAQLLRDYRQDRERGRRYQPAWENRSRNIPAYVRSRYPGILNPLFEPGMSDLDLSIAWFESEGRRRPQFKQPIQDIEHGSAIEWKAIVELELRIETERTGNRFDIPLEEVYRDLMSTHYIRMDQYERMVWMAARMDRNAWNPDDPTRAREYFMASEFRRKNPDAEIRVLAIDLPLTHYAHVEMPQQLAGMTIDVMKWLTR